MSTPLFLPIPIFRQRIESDVPRITLKQLCSDAGVDCRASGAWIDRAIYLSSNDASLSVIAEPGSIGSVLINAPGTDPLQRARLALAIMAYSLHDLVARQSILGASWAKPSHLRGRAKSSRAMSNAERQQKYRQRHAIPLKSKTSFDA
jgi:hypothetical protein